MRKEEAYPSCPAIQWYVLTLFFLEAKLYCLGSQHSLASYQGDIDEVQVLKYEST